MDCSLPHSSVHGIFQARVLEWAAISFSRGSSRPRDRTWISRVVDRRFYRLSHQGSPPSLGIHIHDVYAQYITRNARLDDAQAGIKVTGRNNNNLRYADDTTLMAESEEELKSFLMKVKEESKKAGVKLNIQKTKIVVSGPITSWQIDGENVEISVRFHFLGLQNQCGW